MPYAPGIIYQTDAIGNAMQMLGEQQKQREEEEKNRARQFKSLLEYGDSSGLLPKNQGITMSLEQLEGTLKGKVAKQEMEKQLATLKELEERTKHLRQGNESAAAVPMFISDYAGALRNKAPLFATDINPETGALNEIGALNLASKGAGKAALASPQLDNLLTVMGRASSGGPAFTEGTTTEGTKIIIPRGGVPYPDPGQQLKVRNEFAVNQAAQRQTDRLDFLSKSNKAALELHMQKNNFPAGNRTFMDEHKIIWSVYPDGSKRKVAQVSVNDSLMLEAVNDGTAKEPEETKKPEAKAAPAGTIPNVIKRPGGATARLISEGTLKLNENDEKPAEKPENPPAEPTELEIFLKKNPDVQKMMQEAENENLLRRSDTLEALEKSIHDLQEQISEAAKPQTKKIVGASPTGGVGQTVVPVSLEERQRNVAALTLKLDRLLKERARLKQ